MKKIKTLIKNLVYLSKVDITKKEKLNGRHLILCNSRSRL